jgi:hypothetical protein
VSFKGAHFAKEIVLTCVRWYVAYPLSDCQVEERMQERGVTVDHATINRWLLKYSPQLEAACHRRKRPVWLSWRLDETYRYCWRMKPIRHKRGKPWHTGLGAWSVNEPGSQTIEIESGGARHLLQVGFHQADIATAPEPKRPYPLGECAFDAGALRIELATFFALKIGPHAINGFLL